MGTTKVLSMFLLAIAGSRILPSSLHKIIEINTCGETDIKLFTLHRIHHQDGGIFGSLQNLNK